MIEKRTNQPPSAYETKFAGEAIAKVDSMGTFSGYASVFNVVDLGHEVVEAGAFKKSLAQKGPDNIRMLFQHSPDAPIGRWIEMHEDANGLYVKGQLNLDVERGREIHALIKSGAIDGLSIGFKTLRSRREQSGAVRRILEADLWEVSIVTFPMLPQARVSNVKSHGLPSQREFERWLVRDAGLTRSQAKTIIVKGFASLSNARDAVGNDAAADLSKKIRQATRKFQNI